MKLGRIALVVSLALALVAPATAFAEGSREGMSATDNGIALTVRPETGFIHSIRAFEDVADNLVLEGSEYVLASFEVEGDADGVDLVFYVGPEYAGAVVTVFVECPSGTDEVLEATVAADGTVSVHAEEVEVATIVLDPDTVPAPGAPAASEPQALTTAAAAAAQPDSTIIVIAVAAGAAFAIAACCFIVLAARRRKNGKDA